jgi:hypothetical protein
VAGSWQERIGWGKTVAAINRKPLAREMTIVISAADFVLLIHFSAEIDHLEPLCFKIVVCACRQN